MSNSQANGSGSGSNLSNGAEQIQYQSKIYTLASRAKKIRSDQIKKTKTDILNGR